MKTKITSVLSFLAVLAMAGGKASADTVVLDDYSTDDYQNYTNETYYPSGIANNTYQLATSGGTGVVSSGSNDETEAFFYTPGGTPSISLGLGDTLSLDVTDNEGTTNIVGLAFSTSASNDAANGFQVYVGAQNGDGYSNNEGVAVFSPTGTDDIGSPTSLTGFSNLSVTRLASDPTGETFSFDLTGNGLSDSGTFTEAYAAGDAPIYFGPSYFNHTFDTYNVVEFDNLTLTTPSVPEPSSFALLLVGALGSWSWMRFRTAVQRS